MVMAVELGRGVKKQKGIKVIIIVFIFILFNYLYYVRFYQPSIDAVSASKKRLVALQEEIQTNDLRLIKENNHHQKKVIFLKENSLTEFIVQLNKLGFNLKKKFFDLRIGDLKENKLLIDVHLQSDYNNFLSYLANLGRFSYLGVKEVAIKGDKDSQDSLDIRIKLVVYIAN